MRASLLAVCDLPGYTLCLFAADAACGGRRRTLVASFVVGAACMLGSAAVHAAPADAPAAITVGLSLVGKICAASAFQLGYISPAELFPTSVRGTALGVADFFGRLGALAGAQGANVPPVWLGLALGGISLLAGSAACTLPETRGRGLPQAVDLH